MWVIILTQYFVNIIINWQYFPMLTSDGMDLSVKRIGLYDEKTAPVSSSIKCLLLFVQSNSRKRGPYGSDLSPYVDTTFSSKNNAWKRWKNLRRLYTPTAWTKSKSSPMLLGQNVTFSAAVRTCSVTGYAVKQSRLFHTMVSYNAKLSCLICLYF